MAVCSGAALGSAQWKSEQAARRSLSQDDEIAVQHLTNDSTVSGDEYRAFTGNPSFEEGTSHWGKSSSINHFNTHTSGGGVDGSATYGHVKNTSTSGYVFQTGRLLTTRTDNDPTYARVRVNVRKDLSQNTGTVKYRLRYRSIRYTATRTGCGFPNNLDLTLDDDHPNVINGGWTYHTRYSCTPTSSSSWNYCTSGKKTLDPDDFNNADGWDFRIYVWPRMKYSSGNPIWWYVDLDRSRVLVDDPGA